MVQWLGLSTFTVATPGSIPGQGTKIPHATLWLKKKKKKRKDLREQALCHVRTGQEEGGHLPARERTLTRL